MAEMSKEIKIVILANCIAAFIYAVFQLFIPEIYSVLVDMPAFDVHFTRVSGGTLLVLGIFGLIAIMRKEWDEVKIVFELAVVFEIMLFILDIIYFATIPISMTNFVNTLIATILTIALIIVNIFFYLREQKGK